MPAVENTRLIVIAFFVLGFLQLMSLTGILIGFSLSKEDARTLTETDVSAAEVKPVITVNNESHAEKKRKVAPQSEFSGIVSLSLLLNFVKSILLIAGGLKLLKITVSTKIFGIIAAIASIFSGTAGVLIGIYALWFLTGEKFGKIFDDAGRNEYEPIV